MSDVGRASCLSKLEIKTSSEILAYLSDWGSQFWDDRENGNDQRKQSVLCYKLTNFSHTDPFQ